jgi:WD40 repeat protein
MLASASNDCTVRLWEVDSKTCLRVLQRHADPIERICFSPDGSKLASGANGAVLVWKVDSGALTHVYDRAKSQRKNGMVVSEDLVEISEISWDQGSQRLAIGEGSTKVNSDTGFVHCNASSNRLVVRGSTYMFEATGCGVTCTASERGKRAFLTVDRYRNVFDNGQTIIPRGTLLKT